MSESRLVARFQWLEPTGPSAADATRGTIYLALDHQPLWPADFEWTWIELLEWLNESWRYLQDTTLPFDPTGEGLSVTALEAYATRADMNLRGSPDPAYDSWASLLWDSLQGHDVNSALSGTSGPALAIYRRDLTGYILQDETGHRLPWREVQTWLSQIGDMIVARLETQLPLDRRALLAVEHWATHARRH